MIDVRNLPLTIGNFERRSVDSKRFTMKDRSIGCTYISFQNELVFGSWKPVGAVLKRVKVETEQDVIKAIEEFKYPFPKDKKEN